MKFKILTRDYDPKSLLAIRNSIISSAIRNYIVENNSAYAISNSMYLGITTIMVDDCIYCCLMKSDPNTRYSISSETNEVVFNTPADKIVSLLIEIPDTPIGTDKFPAKDIYNQKKVALLRHTGLTYSESCDRVQCCRGCYIAEKVTYCEKCYRSLFEK